MKIHFLFLKFKILNIRICENLNEAFLLLSQLSNSKEKKIITKSNKEINIIFPTNNVLIKEISLRLKLKEIV